MLDAIALDLANASLDSAGDLGRWLEEAGEWLDPAGSAGSEVPLRLLEFSKMREAVHDLFEASIGGGPLPAAAVERVNEASLRVPRVLRLDVGSGAVAEEGLPASATASVLAAVARSAIGLLGGADRPRLRRCPSCGRFFLASRDDRVWCAPACGNRARVARHYARRARS